MYLLIYSCLCLFICLMISSRGDVCRHLLRASQSDDLAVFSLALRVVFNLFVSIKNHMKVQLEVFLTSVHLRLLTPSLSNSNSKGINNNSNGTNNNNSNNKNKLSSYKVNLAKEELALESLLEFCREPSLMEDLYTNYDCDVQCTNLFDSIIHVLCVRAVPANMSFHKNSIVKNDNEKDKNNNISSSFIDPGSSFQKGNNNNNNSDNNNNNLNTKIRIGILNKLALDGVFAVLQSIAVKCEKSSYKMTRKMVRNSTNVLKASRTTETTPVVCVNGDLSTVSSVLSIPLGEFDGKGFGTGTGTERRAERAVGTGTGTGSETRTGVKTDIIEAVHSVDRWCRTEEQDIKDFHTKGIQLNNNGDSMREKNDENKIEANNNFYETDLTSPISQPDSPLKGFQLTTAALSAHTISTQYQNSQKNIPNHTPCENQNQNQNQEKTLNQTSDQNLLQTEKHFPTFNNYRSSQSQLILRGTSSSPFSANTSIDGRIDILDGDEDNDFFLLARAKSAEVLRQRKLKKQRLRLASEKFNEKPLKPDWMHFALSLGLIRPFVIIHDNNNINNDNYGNRNGNDNDKNDDSTNTNSEKSHETENKSDEKFKEKKKTKKSDLVGIADSESVAKFLRNTPGMQSIINLFKFIILDL